MAASTPDAGSRKRPREASLAPASSFYSSVLGAETSNSDLLRAGELLSWWFGGNAAELGKARWFCRAGTEAQRRCDVVAQRDFGALFAKAEKGSLDHWQAHPYRALALVVLLDQVARHVYRDRRGEATVEARLVALSVQAAAVAKATRDRGDWPHFRPRERVFLLMPLRHVPSADVAGVFGDPDFDALDHVLAAVKEEDLGAGEEAGVVESFRRATVRRQQDALLKGRSDGVVATASAGDADGVPDGPLTAEEEDAILDHVASDRREQEAQMRNHMVVRTMDAFLRDRAASTVFVSLSGGVDSMVIARVLAYLRDQPRHHLRIDRVVALHIHYGNRDESRLEARYLAQFCAVHAIDLRVQEMPDHLRRASTAVSREAYEAQTRDIRFEFYRAALRELGTPSLDATAPAAPEGIMLGHHRGDVEENVLSNALKGAGVLSLGGMEASSVLHKTHIWRPYFPLEKKHILNFAHDFGVPYFKDTTPLWSTRGKIRTQLVPLLHDIYGRGVGSNLALLAEESREYRELFDETLLRPALDSVERSRLGLALPIQTADVDLRDYGVLFWRAVLRQMLHSLGIGALRESSVRELLLRLRRNDALKAPTWLELRKDALAFLGDGKLFVLHPGFAFCGVLDVTEALAPKLRDRRPHQFQPWGEHGARVPVGDDAIFEAGPWRIRARATREVGRCPAGRVSLKRKEWPPVEADIGGVSDLFRRGQEAGAVMLAYELPVGRAALEAQEHSLSLHTAVPDAKERFVETSLWRQANRKMAQVIPRVELPDVTAEIAAQLPESDLVMVRVEYAYIGNVAPLVGASVAES